MADLTAAEAKAWMVKVWRDLETARRAAGGDPPSFTTLRFTTASKRRRKPSKRSSFATAKLTRRPTNKSQRIEAEGITAPV